MSLRALLLVFLSTVFLFGFVFVVVSVTLLREQALLLFSPERALEANQALNVLLVQQALGLLVSAVVLLGALFFMLNRFFIRPVKDITEAMIEFSQQGTHQELPDLEKAPRELRSLGAAFLSMAQKIETTKQTDVEVSRIKSDFITTAAHQLRTPLTGVRWALEALMKESMTESQKALVKNATDKSHDLVSIVGMMLDISAIESGKYQYEFVSVDMQALLEEVARDFAPLAAERGISLFYAKGEGPVDSARADRERIKWVLNNLVENAIHYTPSGGTIRISVESGSGRVFVRVRDTGIGIPAKDRNNIFERFYRASNASAKENAGNGLGLYIARTIATDHGGELNFADNTEGPGTIFTLSLPTSGPVGPT